MRVEVKGERNCSIPEAFQGVLVGISPKCGNNLFFFSENQQPTKTNRERGTIYAQRHLHSIKESDHNNYPFKIYTWHVGLKVSDKVTSHPTLECLIPGLCYSDTFQLKHQGRIANFWLACEQAPRNSVKLVRNAGHKARSGENWSLQACLCKSNVCVQILDANRWLVELNIHTLHIHNPTFSFPVWEEVKLQTRGKMKTEGKMQTADCRPEVEKGSWFEIELKVTNIFNTFASLHSLA